MNSATVDKKTFVDRLSTLNRVINRKSFADVLLNIYVEIAEDNVVLRSTNLEMYESATIPAKTEGEPCAVTIPSAMMLKLLKKAPKKADVITLSIDEETACLDVKVGTLSLHLKGISAEEFPGEPIIAPEVKVDINPEEFMSALNQVLPAVAQDDRRPILAGVHFSLRDRLLTLESADGFRLAVRKLMVDYEGKSCDVILPGDMIKEVARELKGQAEDVRVSIGEEYVEVKTETMTVAGRPVIGSFPDVNVIIPRESTTFITLQAKDLMAALGVVEPISREGANIVRLGANGKLTVTATSVEMGSASQIVPANTQGNNMEIAFNVQFLKDAIGCVGETVSMGMTTYAHPVVFRPEGDDSYLHLLMPMHLNR